MKTIHPEEYESIEQCDYVLRQMRMSRAKLVAFGVTNQALRAIDDYADRILDRRAHLNEIANAALELLFPDAGPGNSIAD